MALRTIGIGAFLAAGLVLGVVLTHAVVEDSASLASAPSAIDLSTRQVLMSDQLRESPPLVRQAEVFAAYLNPPSPVPQHADPNRAPVREVISRAVSPVSPPVATPRFKVCATSFCSAEPEKSMALIAELGSPEGTRRWIGEGTQIGHFTIQEIRQGSVVCREINSERVHEMAVEHESPRNILVRSPTGLAQAGQRGEDDIVAGGLDPEGASQ